VLIRVDSWIVSLRFYKHDPLIHTNQHEETHQTSLCSLPIRGTPQVPQRAIEELLQSNSKKAFDLGMLTTIGKCILRL